MIGMIRRILGVSGKYKGRIYGAMGFSFLKGLLMKVPIILTYFIVTTYIDGTLTKKTALYGAIALVASIIVQAVFQYLADRLQSGAGYLIFADMRMKLASGRSRPRRTSPSSQTATCSPARTRPISCATPGRTCA